MSTRRAELTRVAARLFAEKGYHGTSVGDLAQALGVQKGSLYDIDSKADLLWEVAREGAEAFHAALDAVPDEGPVVERIRLALRAHLRVVAEQLDIATVFVRSGATSRASGASATWQSGAATRSASAPSSGRAASTAAAHRPRRRHRRAARALVRDWAYTWLRPGADTDAWLIASRASAGRDARVRVALGGGCVGGNATCAPARVCSASPERVASLAGGGAPMPRRRTILLRRSTRRARRADGERRDEDADDLRRHRPGPCGRSRGSFACSFQPGLSELSRFVVHGRWRGGGSGGRDAAPARAVRRR